MTARALENIRVVDFSRFMAGPTCTLVLGDLGAEVIKLERPGSGDALRYLPPQTKGEEATFFINLNLGKKGVTLNLASERGAQIVKELIKGADVLVENFSPDVMDRLGLGYEELSKINPGLIYASLSGFGQTGPRRSGTAFDIIAQAMGGLISINGFPDSPPIKVGTAISDTLGGLYMAIAVLAALHYREKTGEGQWIDVSMQDCVWAVTAVEHAGFYFVDNKIPRKPGNGYPNDAGTNIYRTKDDYVIISAITNEQFDSVLRAIGREDLVGKPGYATPMERVNNRGEVDTLVEGWTKARSVEEIVDIFAEARVPCAPVPTFDRVANDPQLLHREMIVEVEQTKSGKVKVPGSVFKMSKTPGNTRFPAPYLGEHNQEIYSKILGYSDQEIRDLQEDGII